MAEDKVGRRRQVTARKWSGLALSAVAATALAPMADAAGVTGGPERLWLAQAEGGEGGEGGSLSDVDEAEVATALVVGLNRIEAHLIAAEALATLGDVAAARAHLTKAATIVLPAIAPELARKGAPDLAPSLNALAQARELAGPMTAARQTLAQARAAIAPSPADQFTALAALVREAADDFGAGTKDGRVTEAPEYQDAWAYVQTALVRAEALQTDADPNVQKAAGKARAALEKLAAMLPGVIPADPIKADPPLILSTAAVIELVSSGVGRK